MERFPEKLRKARKNAGLNQTQLAVRVGVTQRSLTDYECGRAVPRKNTMRKLAEAVGVTVEYLSRDEVEDPQAGRLREERVNTARDMFGSRGEKEMAELLERNTAFLAGGDVDQEAKDAFFDALMTAYITCKNEAKAKFSAKNTHKEPED